MHKMEENQIKKSLFLKNKKDFLTNYLKMKRNDYTFMKIMKIVL